ncbi:S1 RNA-binding domain-containing protein [Patescibacteria group bacterium]|nr:S1 RNA-binding domain-containing protein [Patescibacteria group bacterium]MBU4274206.1 S1 RNA-binding domain-containing protein [Patescibacteria group bacterium]MBU4367302.1 S1 RNA-binding domain-containing protein [Patescibacteria group bacterium]MBU4461639.1 S1 RNA-binding domain-containing protein [Patescibacteria group bacterium]MCG2699689.1 S1 RNA-binding domain-containing protein [Candidatus Parcubacteria bacterium]
MEQDIIKNEETPSQISKGSIAEGTVVGRDRSSLFVDLGIHGNGIIYGREFYEAKRIIKDLKVGDKIYAKVTELENEDGYKELSLREATKQIGWQKLRDIKEKGDIFKVKITGVNKGGLLTAVEDISAFLPVSQLSPEHYPRVADADRQKILKELQKFIGQTLEVKILDLLAEENKLILSEKAKSEEKIKEILENYKKGDVIDGEISGIANFGVFIKFPVLPAKDSVSQIEGLIHISELDWQLIENPADLVKIGEVIKAQIIEIKNSQVFLSLKSLKKNPWESLEKKYKKGDKVTGKVTKFNPFGAFVQIESAPASDASKNEAKIQGLCHISEFGSQKKMEEMLKIGQVYEFQISAVEPKEYRMSLKLIKKE